MAEIVRRRSWGGVLPLGRHVSISGSRSIHAPSVSIAPSSFQEEQNARHHNRFKREQALVLGFCGPDRVRHTGAPRPKRLLGTFGRVVNRLMLDLSVQLGTNQDDSG